MALNSQLLTIQNKRPDSLGSGIEIREGLEGLTPAKIATLYRRAPLQRSYHSREKLWEAFESASLVLTAWQKERVFGILRILSDKAMFSFICDFAVEPDVQGLGVGKELIQKAIEKCKGTKLYISDNATRAGFYEKLGFKFIHETWVYDA